MFEPKQFTDIFADLRARSGLLTDFEPGSVTRTLYESVAYEFALMYEKMNLIYLSAFIDSAEGRELEQVVAILGLQRGLPDFARGQVTLARDPGRSDIDIPLGTLVATEDTPEVPRKVYRTMESVTFAADASELAVKVQAAERGDEMATDAETVVVMPRPLPGVKGVNNPAPILFTGKGLETDDELRERARNTLIASGKATRLSVEDAVLGLPGVRAVKIDEPDSEFGVIDVYVDGVDMLDVDERARVRAAIDRTRAAGVFVRLHGTALVVVDVEVTVVLAAGTSDEQQARTDSVQTAVDDYLKSLGMGEPLLFSQLTRAILNVEDVDGVLDVDELNFPGHPGASKRIEVGANERVSAGDITVTVAP